MVSRKVPDKLWPICFTAAILCQIYFLIQLIFFFDGLAWSPAWRRSLSYEEWGWLIEQNGNYRYLGRIEPLERASAILAFLFAAAVLFGYVYILSSKARRRAVGGQFFIFAVFFGCVLDFGCFLYNKYWAVHYRMFMPFIPIVIFSAVLMILLLRLRHVWNHLDSPEQQ